MGPSPAGVSDAHRTQAVAAPRPARRWLPWAAVLSVVLAGGVGLGAGWLYYRDDADADRPRDDSGSVKAALGERKELEEFLLKAYRLRANPVIGEEERQGLGFAADLTVLYLKDDRLEDAERFFAELNSPEQKKASYRTLGALGQAMVLAFRDRPKESNEGFLRLLTKRPGDKFAGGKAPWVTHPRLREMVARALNHNHANAPDQFPPALQFLRRPPSPPAQPKATGKQ
jgi:hypothetical protein